MKAASTAAVVAASVLIAWGNRPAVGPAPSKITQLGLELDATQELTVGLDTAPTTLDPALAVDTSTQRVLDDLFEGLVTMGIDGQPVPGVASSWSVSDDGKTWTFHLRHEARWSNGERVTAQDFIYAWRREVDPKTGAGYGQTLAPLLNAPEILDGKLPPTSLGVEAADPHTLIVHLSAPVPYLLTLLDQSFFAPLYAPAIEQWGDTWARPETMVNNGAYRLEEDIHSSRVTLTKNPYYWDATHVRLQRINYLAIPDGGVQSLRYQSGEVQFAYNFPSSQYDWLKSRLPDEAVTAPWLGTYMLEFNMNLPPFKGNPALRQALSMSVDREALAHYFKRGLNVPAADLVPPLGNYHPAVPPWATLRDEQRYQQARRLYAEAGYSAKHPLRVELSAPNQGPDSRHVLEAIVAMWYQHLGAEVALDLREHKVLLQDEALHKLPLFQFAWIGDYSDPLTFLDVFTSESEQNYAGYSNPQFDSLIQAASLAADPARRFEILQQAEKALNDDAVIVPLYFYSSRHLIKPYVKGWESNIVDRHPSRFMYVLEHASNQVDR